MNALTIEDGCCKLTLYPDFLPAPAGDFRKVLQIADKADMMEALIAWVEEACDELPENYKENAAEVLKKADCWLDACKDHRAKARLYQKKEREARAKTDGNILEIKALHDLYREEWTAAKEAKEEADDIRRKAKLMMSTEKKLAKNRAALDAWTRERLMR